MFLLFVLYQENHEDTRVVQLLPLSACLLAIYLHTGKYINSTNVFYDEFLIKTAWIEVMTSGLSQLQLQPKK